METPRPLLNSSQSVPPPTSPALPTSPLLSSAASQTRRRGPGWVAVLLLVLGGSMLASLGTALVTSQLTKSTTTPPLSTPVTSETPHSELIPPIAPASSDEQAVQASVATVRPVVVSVIARKKSSEVSTGAEDLFSSPFFKEFFDIEGLPQQPEQDAASSSDDELVDVSGGSGFFVTEDGLIVTNRHVVADQTATYVIITQEGEEIPATVLARDPANDLAIMDIEGSKYPAAKLGDSKKIQLGETVIAIGNALGTYPDTVTKGVISAVGRSLVAGAPGEETTPLSDVLQTDAAINLGNSGGPLVNTEGEVIGINTAMDASGQLIGFAIPINQAKAALESVRATGRIVRPYLGVRYVPNDPKTAEANDIPFSYGIIVTGGSDESDPAVVPGGPADKAGIQENDVIAEFDGQKIDGDHPFTSLIAQHGVGDEVTLKLWSKGNQKTIRVTLEERPQTDDMETVSR